MATRNPPEFRQHAIELVRPREQPLQKTAADLGIQGRRELTTEERAEVVQLRRRNRALEMEVEILKRGRLLRTGRPLNH